MSITLPRHRRALRYHSGYLTVRCMLRSVISSARDAVVLPPAAWRRPEVRRALRARDAAALLAIAQQHTGVSQAHLASAIGLGQGRVNELINRKREVVRLDLFERIADGLNMPDAARMMLGLAPATARQATDLDDLAEATSTVARSYHSQQAAAREIKQLARGARSLDLLAVRGLGLLGLNDSLLRAAVTGRRDRPLAIRVLIVDADSEAAARRAIEIGETPAAFATAVRLAEHKLRDLAATPGLTLEAYRYTTLPTWRIIALDETLFVSTFDADWEGHASPIYRIDIATGGALHRGFRRMFHEMTTTADRFM
jgi:transcriptional regulator with XRE-family HTH domain